MNFPTLLIYINFVVCSLAAIRLAAYRRNGAQYKFLSSFMAWMLIVVFGSIPLRILTDQYVQADPFEVAINVILCLQIIRSDGNINRIFGGVKADDIR
ncbi:phage holin family protein [Providencia rettgeri]|nr:phage holin family protein [Providencia rettgeri]